MGETPRTHRRQVMTVQRADQSPMNPKRWCLTLSCGHEVWVTADRKPKQMKAECDRCPMVGAEVGAQPPADEWRNWCRYWLAEHLIPLDDITFDDLAVMVLAARGASSPAPSTPQGEIIICDGCHFSFDVSETSSGYCLRCTRCIQSLGAHAFDGAIYDGCRCGSCDRVREIISRAGANTGEGAEHGRSDNIPSPHTDSDTASSRSRFGHSREVGEAKVVSSGGAQELERAKEFWEDHPEASPQDVPRLLAEYAVSSNAQLADQHRKRNEEIAELRADCIRLNGELREARQELEIAYKKHAETILKWDTDLMELERLRAGERG